MTVVSALKRVRTGIKEAVSYGESSRLSMLRVETGQSDSSFAVDDYIQRLYNHESD